MFLAVVPPWIGQFGFLLSARLNGLFHVSRSCTSTMYVPPESSELDYGALPLSTLYFRFRRLAAMTPLSVETCLPFLSCCRCAQHHTTIHHSSGHKVKLDNVLRVGSESCCPLFSYTKLPRLSPRILSASPVSPLHFLCSCFSPPGWSVDGCFHRNCVGVSQCRNRRTSCSVRNGRVRVEHDCNMRRSLLGAIFVLWSMLILCGLPLVLAVNS